MKYLNRSETYLIAAFLFGKLSGMLTVGHWSAVGDHWSSLVYSAIFLPALFVGLNAYDSYKARRKARA